MGTPDGILVGGLIAVLALLALRYGYLAGRHRMLKESLKRVRKERDELRDTLWQRTVQREG